MWVIYLTKNIHRQICYRDRACSRNFSDVSVRVAPKQTWHPLVSYSSTRCKSGKKFLSGAFRPYPEGGTGSGVFDLFQNLL